jgi:hypothetical protein
MARVPLYNGGVPPQAPQGARIPLPTPLPAGQGAAAMGEALGQVGNVMGVLAQKQQQANDTRQLIEAEGEMRKQAMEFQQFQQTTTDQEQWLPAWQERQAGMQKYMDGLKLTDGARLRLTSSFGQWSDNHAISIQGEAFKQAVGRARMAVFTRAEETAKAGNLNGAYNALSMLPKNSAWPEEIDAKKIELQGMAKSAQINQTQDVVAHLVDNKRDFNGAIEAVKASPMEKEKKERVIGGIEHERELYDLSVIGQNQPKEAISLVQEKAQAGKVSWLEADRIIQQAKSRELEMSNEATADYALRLRQGGNKEFIMEEVISDPKLTEKAKQDLNDHINARVNHAADYADLFARAKGFEGQKGSPEYGAFLNEVDLHLNGQQKSDVQAVIENSATSKQDYMTRTKAQFYSSVADEIKQTVRVPLLEAAKLPPEIEAQVATFRRDVKPREKFWFAADRLKPVDEQETEARKAWYKSQTRNAKDVLPLKNYVVEDYLETENRSRKYLQILQDVEAYDLKNKPMPDELRGYFNKQMGKKSGIRSSVGGGMPTGQMQTSPTGILPVPSAADIEELRGQIKRTK